LPETSAVRVAKMVEELWYHALMFLDKYRTGSDSCNIVDLYQFADKTGILSTHQQCLAQPFQDSQVDMKIMYYELIKMITAHERDNCKDEDLYDSTKSVAKIEGYQELTNKLQRFLNQRFIMDIAELNKKRVGDNLAVSSDVNINMKMGNLERSFEVLAADHKILRESCASLESANKGLESEIAKLKEKIMNEETEKDSSLRYETNLASNLHEHQLCPNSVEANISKLSDTLLEKKIYDQNEAIAKLDDKMEKVINQANTLLINDATHLERISNLEKQGAEFVRKLSNLESADLYLQESHRMVTERTSLVEKYSKYVEEKVNVLTQQRSEERSSIHINDKGMNIIQEGLNERVRVLERSVLNIQKNINIHEDIIDIKDQNVSRILTTIENTKVMNNTRKENNKHIHFFEKNDNENLSNYSELVEKYTTILNKVEKMESLLSQKSHNSEMFSKEYLKNVAEHVNKDFQKETTKICKESFTELKSEKLETSTHSEFHTKEIVDENLVRDVNNLKEEVNKIKNQLFLYYNDQSKSSDKLTNVENHVLELFRKPSVHNSIFEFLEMLVGMNKSLNNMMEEIVSSQTAVELVRSEQEQVWNRLGEQKQTIESQEEKFEKKICEHEMIIQKLDNMENILDLMREKVNYLEEIRESNKSAKTATVEDFSIDGSTSELKDKGLPSSKPAGNSKWLGNWFAKQQGTICC